MMSALFAVVWLAVGAPDVQPSQQTTRQEGVVSATVGDRAVAAASPAANYILAAVSGEPSTDATGEEPPRRIFSLSDLPAPPPARHPTIRLAAGPPSPYAFYGYRPWYAFPYRYRALYYRSYYAPWYQQFYAPYYPYSYFYRPWYTIPDWYRGSATTYPSSPPAVNPPRSEHAGRYYW